MKIIKFFIPDSKSYSGSACSLCECKQFVISDDPQFCDNCGHSRSSHYGTWYKESKMDDVMGLLIMGAFIYVFVVPFCKLFCTK